jgi:hypothetical protein
MSSGKKKEQTFIDIPYLMSSSISVDHKLMKHSLEICPVVMTKRISLDSLVCQGSTNGKDIVTINLTFSISHPVSENASKYFNDFTACIAFSTTTWTSKIFLFQIFWC